MNSSIFFNVILELCKGVHCVDLGESFQTHIYSQNSALIQPRTRPSVILFRRTPKHPLSFQGEAEEGQAWPGAPTRRPWLSRSPRSWRSRGAGSSRGTESIWNKNAIRYLCYQTVEGTFTAVSKPIFQSRYSGQIIFQALQVVHTSTPL